MVIISKEAFPPKSANEMGKIFLKSPPLPAFITMKGPYVSFEVGVGIKIISIYEFDQSKMKEALEVVSNRYVDYFEVPGFTYAIEMWQEPAEALKLIGLG